MSKREKPDTPDPTPRQAVVFGVLSSLVVAVIVGHYWLAALLGQGTLGIVVGVGVWATFWSVLAVAEIASRIGPRLRSRLAIRREWRTLLAEEARENAAAAAE